MIQMTIDYKMKKMPLKPKLKKIINWLPNLSNNLDKLINNYLKIEKKPK